MKVKEILNLKSEELEKMMTEEEHNKMEELGLDIYQLLDALQDSARESNQDEEEEHITVSAYLDYLENIRGSVDEI